jgi:diamine N-acetyltransferase
MSFNIRPVQESDFKRLVELFNEFAVFEKRPEKMKNTVEQMMLEKDYFQAYVATIDNQIVGFASYFISYHTWSGKCVYMDDLYVSTLARGTGIGKALMDKVIDYAQKEKCKKVRWQVSDWNINAQDFYESLGASIHKGEYVCDLDL